MAEQLICNEKSVAVREGTFLPTLQSPYNFTFATVAQLVEQLIRNQQIVSSSLTGGSRYFKGLRFQSQPLFVSPHYLGLAMVSFNKETAP